MGPVVKDHSLYNGDNHRNQTVSWKAKCPKDEEGLCRHREETFFLHKEKKNKVQNFSILYKSIDLTYCIFFLRNPEAWKFAELGAWVTESNLLHCSSNCKV